MLGVYLVSQRSSVVYDSCAHDLTLRPDDYQPQFFGNLNKIEQDVSFLTWQHLRSKEHAPPPSAPIGPLNGFTWPPAAHKTATWDLPSPEEIQNW